MGTIQIDGSTPKLTIGNATAEDATILFDGNAQDFYIALDDSADDLVIGLGSTVGTTPAVSIDENLQVIVHDNLSLLSDSSVLKFGTDGDTTLTHTDGTGLTLNGTNKLCFNDATQFIQGASGTVLDINATDEIELNATAVDLNGTLDVSGTSTLTGAVTMAAALSAKGGIVVNEDQGNVDFRVESDDKSHIFFCDASANVCGTSLEDGTAPQYGQFHIRNSSAGQGTMPANGDELIIEGNGHMGMTILSAAANTGNIFFGDSGDNDIGGITYNHNDNSFAVTTAGAEVFRLTSDGQIGTRGETAPDVNNGGMTLNHGGDDGKILTFKNSDISHALTDIAEADTYGLMQKRHATSGGVAIKGLSEDTTPGVEITGFIGGTAAQTGKNAGSDGCVNIRAAMRSSNDGVTLDANGNLMNIKGLDTNKFIFDVDGDFHADNSSTTFDAYDDAQLARAYDLSHGRGVIKSKFDKFIAYNHEHLADLKLVGREEDGTPSTMVNITGMQQLHNGAIWQQYEKHERLLEAVYDLAKLAVGEDKANAILDKHEVKRLQ